MAVSPEILLHHDVCPKETERKTNIREGGLTGHLVTHFSKKMNAATPETLKRMLSGKAVCYPEQYAFLYMLAILSWLFLRNKRLRKNL